MHTLTAATDAGAVLGRVSDLARTDWWRGRDGDELGSGSAVSE